MIEADREDLSAQAAKRANFRVHHVGTKLNDRERRELETLLVKRGQTQGKFIRDLILEALARDVGGLRASVEKAQKTVEEVRTKLKEEGTYYSIYNTRF